MRVVIVERNKPVARRVARVLVATGASVQVFEDPAHAQLDGADLVCGDTFDGDFIAEQTRARGIRGVLWTAEPLKRSLRFVLETRGIDHVLARRDFDSAPRTWELAMVGRRLATGAVPQLSDYLNWGFQAVGLGGAELDVGSTAERDTAVAKIAEVVGQLGVPQRIVEMICEVGHELIMNAIYDAPVDRTGKPRYAADRKAAVRLANHERPRVQLATDGTTLALRVRDPFGRLTRHHVFDGLARGLGGGAQDRAGGGAGLGMLICHNATTAMVFDVASGRSTEVTALLELDTNLRELRNSAKSVQFWSTT
jgi:hypothetical protein